MKNNINQVVALHWTDISIQLCGRAKLKAWSIKDTKAAYWRLYWHPHDRTVLKIGSKSIRLAPQNIYLIAPQTQYQMLIHDPNLGDPHFFCSFIYKDSHASIYNHCFSLELRETYKKKLESTFNDQHEDLSTWIYPLILDSLNRVSPPDAIIDPKQIQIQKAIQFIHSHFREEIDLQRLCRLSHCSKTHLMRLFKDHTGATPHQYLLNTRLMSASDLLKRTHLTIDEITLLCGFKDRFYFSRMFKKKFYTAPAQYRNNMNEYATSHT